jgi:hypothetical protein
MAAYVLIGAAALSRRSLLTVLPTSLVGAAHAIAGDDSTLVLSRRSLLTVMPTSLMGAAHVSAGDDSTLVLASGIVSMPRADGEGPAHGALYVTARLASGGAMTKQPPIAAARFPCPLHFPYAFELKMPADLTAEYAGAPVDFLASQDLIISARLDTDGVAATRDPDDLIGRGGLSKQGSASGWAPVAIELQGRGLTGRILTGK